MGQCRLLRWRSQPEGLTTRLERTPTHRNGEYISVMTRKRPLP